MRDFMANVVFYSAIGLSLLFVASLFLCKRKDISWVRFMIAGPLVLVHPREYFIDRKQSVPLKLFASAMGMFAASWIVVWWGNNGV